MSYCYYFTNIQQYKICIILILTLQPSKPYQILSLKNLEDNQQCVSPLHKTVKLNSSSGFILSLASDEDLQNDFICEFAVRAAGTNNGIFAIIQKLNLRSDYETHECIDYVVYKRNNASISRQYCDILTRDDDVNLMPTLQGFVDPKGVLDVSVFISKQELKPKEALRLEIVFTSYRYCFRNSSQDDRPCSSKYKAHCIYKDFFTDGYVNCPYPGCVDEKKCFVKPSVKEASGPSVLYLIIGTVIAIIVLVFIVTIFAIYLCWRFRNSCCSVNPQVIELNEFSTRPQVNSYAPVPPKPLEEQDLPPSYDTLFPD